MRTITKAALALSFVGAMAVSAPEPAKAQGVYLSGPGVEVEVGDPYWRHRRHYRRNYYRDYGAADPGHPYGYNYDYGDPRCGIPNYTIQDGVCKPYRGY
jgi:hypothetical protein